MMTKREQPLAEHYAIVTERDLTFAGGPRPLHWDVHRPREQTGLLPAVLLFHGGAWEVGDRSHVADAAQLFAAQGFVALCVEYRLTKEAAWPAQLFDARCAIRAARDQATNLQIDPNLLFLAGFSAGAHLALLAASGAQIGKPVDGAPPGGAEAVAGVAAYFPPARLSPQDAARLGLTAAGDVEAASPTTHAAKLPPTIIFCRDEDVITPHHLSIELFKAIRSAGVESDLRLFGGLIHEFVRLPNMLDTTIRDAVEFFDRTALSREAFDRSFEELRQWWKQILSGQAPH